MKLTTLVIVALGASAVAGADTARYIATLVNPVAGGKQDVAASGNLWRCVGTSCTLVSPPNGPASLGACRSLKSQLDLSAYGRSDQLFDADKLAKCNSSH